MGVSPRLATRMWLGSLSRGSAERFRWSRPSAFGYCATPSVVTYASLLPVRLLYLILVFKNTPKNGVFLKMRSRWESNPRMTVLQTVALATWLRDLNVYLI